MYGLISIEISGDCSVSIGEKSRGTGKWHFNHIFGRKGFGIGVDKDDIECRGALIIPCERQAIHTVRDFLQMQQLMKANGTNPLDFKGPYYLSIPMSRNESFEMDEDSTALFGGPHTAYAGDIAFNDKGGSILERAFENVLHHLHIAPAAHAPRHTLSEDEEDKLLEEGIPYARMNCWSEGQGITQYIAGIDMAEIDPALPYFYRAKHACRWRDMMVRSLLAGNAPDHDSIAIDEGIAMGRKKGFSPFILMKEDLFYATSILEAEIEVNGAVTSVDEYLEGLAKQSALFKSKPAAQHNHMNNNGRDKPALRP